jgi:TrmH family RNA methyltransferase
VLSKSGVKYIQSLYHKKFRDEEDLFVAEGVKTVKEFLLHAADLLHRLYALPEWIESNMILLEHISPEKIFQISNAELQRISSLATPNQVLAVMQKKPQQPVTPSGKETILMLDDIQDPGNMGTIIRTADWFGINSILCGPGCADMYNAKVLQSTMGSIIRVNMQYTNLTDWHEKHDHIPIYGCTLSGTSVYEFRAETGCIILVGNESKGIRPELLSRCAAQITIPRLGGAESLNASVATGIVLSVIMQKR